MEPVTRKARLLEHRGAEGARSLFSDTTETAFRRRWFEGFRQRWLDALKREHLNFVARLASVGGN